MIKSTSSRLELLDHMASQLNSNTAFEDDFIDYMDTNNVDSDKMFDMYYEDVKAESSVGTYDTFKDWFYKKNA